LFAAGVLGAALVGGAGSSPNAAAKSYVPHDSMAVASGSEVAAVLTRSQRRQLAALRRVCVLPAGTRVRLTGERPVTRWSVSGAGAARVLWTSMDRQAGPNVESCGTRRNGVGVAQVHAALVDRVQRGWGFNPTYVACGTADGRPIDEVPVDRWFTCSVYGAGGVSFATVWVRRGSPPFRILLAE
jgi:hypothetical protein